MAQGDVRGGIFDIAAGGLARIQPAAGEHWRIDLACFDGGNNFLALCIATPTLITVIRPESLGHPQVPAIGPQYLTLATAADRMSLKHLFINNGFHLAVINRDSLVREFAFTGIQIK